MSNCCVWGWTSHEQGEEGRCGVAVVHEGGQGMQHPGGREDEHHTRELVGCW